jgi:ENTS family enterobactin (siderophore) exporter
VGRTLLLDLRPLRVSPDYRRLFAAHTFGSLGSGVCAVAIPYQVYALSHSSAFVGLVSAAEAIPLIVGLLAGGVFADRLDRRRLLIASRLASAAVQAALALNGFEQHLWLLFLLAPLSMGVGGFGAPSHRAAVPGLVGRELLPSVAALDATVGNAFAILGPAAGGLLIAVGGIAVTYLVALAGQLVALAGVVRLSSMMPNPQGERLPPPLRALADGWRFLRKDKMLQGLFAVDVGAMFFGMPRAAFPALAVGTFGGGAQSVGLLYAAPGIGALVAAATSNWLSRVKRQGLTTVVAACLWGFAITLVGLAVSLPVALFFLALAGAADVTSEILRSTILQLTVPDHVRGRVNALWLAQAVAAPQLGDAEAGLVAGALSPRAAITSGGGACVASVLFVVARWPAFARFRLDVPSLADTVVVFTPDA